MGLLASLLNADSGGGTPPPTADFWYQPLGTVSATGQTVTPDGAQTVSAFFRLVQLLSNDVAKVPLELYERLPNGDRAKARGNPLYDLLHTQPNAWQTSFEWRRQGVRHILLRGNWYNRILPGRRGIVDQLVPINPDLVRPQQIAGGRLIYHVRDSQTGRTTQYQQDDIFHVRGVSDDGIEGKSLLTWARESVGIAIATEGYAGRLFSQGSLHSGVVSVPGKLDHEASKRMARSFITSKDQWHLPKVLEQGAIYTESTLTPEDSQFLLSRQFSVTEMARWGNVPPHKLYDLSRSTNNNIEQQAIEYVGDGPMPFYVLIEQAILRDLILNPTRFFAEFAADGLLRGDSAARGEFYSKLFTTGSISPKMIAQKENLESPEGGDQWFVPVNMRPLDQPFTDPAATAAAAAAPAEIPPAEPSRGSAQARAIIVASAARMIRAEALDLKRKAVKMAADDAWPLWVRDYYGKHTATAADVLQVSLEEARLYCDGQAEQVLVDLHVLDQWATRAYAEQIADWALGAEAG